MLLNLGDVRSFSLLEWKFHGVGDAMMTDPEGGRLGMLYICKNTRLEPMGLPQPEVRRKL